ncbi:MAG: hypothetical protein ACLT1W_11250 [Alistipes onderdonkii]
MGQLSGSPAAGVLGGYGGALSLGSPSADPAYQNGFIGREVLLTRLKADGRWSIRLLSP